MKNNKFPAEIIFEPDNSISISVKLTCDPTPREEMVKKLANLMDSFTKREGVLPCTFTDDEGNILFTNKN